MKNWYIFYISLLFALLVNGYFGIYKENWMYAESINMFCISVLCFANAYEYFSKKKGWVQMAKSGLIVPVFK